MKLQKVRVFGSIDYTSDLQRQINEDLSPLLRDGYLITKVKALPVSMTGEENNVVHSRVLFVLEKEEGN